MTELANWLLAHWFELLLLTAAAGAVWGFFSQFARHFANDVRGWLK